MAQKLSAQSKKFGLLVLRGQRHRRKWGDEGAAALLGRQHSLTLEVGVRLDNRVRIDREIDGESPYRWQLFACAQSSGGDPKADLILDLPVNWHATLGV